MKSENKRSNMKTDKQKQVGEGEKDSMKKTWTAILLCICLLFTLLPAKAFAAETSIDVGGVELWGDADHIAYALTDADGNVSTEGASASNYQIAWDGETLTLNGATITRKIPSGEQPDETIYRRGDLRMELKGENTVTGPSGAGFSQGIYLTDGSLTIASSDGNGSLRVTGGDTHSEEDPAYSYGLYAPQVTIESGTVTATGGKAVCDDPELISISAGIWTGEFNLLGGTVTASGGIVTAPGGTAGESYGCGLYLNGINHEVNIKGGVLIAEGGLDKVGTTYGVSIFSGDFNIQGGEVTVKGNTAAFRAQNVRATPQTGTAVLVEAGASADAIEFENTYMSEVNFTEEVEAYSYFHSWTLDRSQVPSSIYVGGQELEGGNGVTAYAVTGADGAVSTEGASADQYQIAWDGQTLTLRNAVITQGSHWDAAIYYDMGDLTVRLEGENTVAGPSGGSYSSGLLVWGNLTFEGTGSLHASGGAVEDSGSRAEAQSHGIELYESLTISGGTVTAAGGTATVEGESSYGRSDGIYIDNAMIVTGGTVTATGGTVTAEGAESEARSDGVLVGEMTIAGGTATATGGTATAEGESVYARSYGMNALKTMITGGTFTAVGGDSAFYLSTDWGVSVTINPQDGQEILVRAGADESTAGTLTGSPFGSEQNVENILQGIRYFRSEQTQAGAHVHAGTLVAGQEATCTEDGKQAYYTCACGKFFEDAACTKEIDDLESWGVIQQLEHTWSTDYRSEHADAEKHYHVCTACGEKDAGEAHTWNVEAATEETDKHCTVCGYVAEQKLEQVHTGILVAEKKATCTAEGYTGDTICRDCGEILEKGEAIPMLAHSYQGGICTVCGALDAGYVPTDPAAPTDPASPTTPTDPADSTEPTTPASSTGQNDEADDADHSPKTGDDFHMISWILLILISGSGVLILSVLRAWLRDQKKRNK